jgi:hypothetical protein
MSQLTQHEVFQTIRQEAKRKQEEGTTLTKAVITKYLKDLYDPHLKGRLYFYAQDKSGLPVSRIPTYVAGRKHHCSIALGNVFSAKDWRDQPKPVGFIGKVWPPKVIGDLIGDVDETEYAIKDCYLCKEDDICRCGYDIWRDYWPDYWPTNLSLQDAGARGYGLFARKAIKDSITVGEYTGRIRPLKTDGASGENVYCIRISIGGHDTEGKLPATAQLDALHTGSMMRFLNHSCNPNARLQEFQCGLERRVIYVVTTRVVPINEEITVDYGPDWLTGDCLCGSAGCRNPPKNPEVFDAAPTENFGETKTTDENEDEDEDESLEGDVSDSSGDSVKVDIDDDADDDSDSDVWDKGYPSSDPEYEEPRKKKRRTH